MIFRKTLIIGILLLLFSIGLGDFLLSKSYRTLTLKPYQSTTISQAEVLAREPIAAQSASIITFDGTNIYSLNGPSAVINTQNRSVTLIILHNNILLDVIYSLILISSILIIISILGLLYIYIKGKNDRRS